MIDGGDTQFGQVQILIGEIDRLQRAPQQSRLFGRFAGTTIGKTFAALISIRKFVPVAPAAGVDQLVDRLAP